ncbi:hypothetical protein GJAV_G00004150 [Gymnothorax javanicus]|nr:hypothetical protein GJAV_G00004150 [Gymnothorax javanicus]
MRNSRLGCLRLRQRLLACPVSYPEVLSSQADLREEETDLFPEDRFCLVLKMKPQETQLISEISELQTMVSELKEGFTSAMLELSHIQQEDSRLREDLELTKQHCDQETLQLRALVYSLKTDLQEVRSQICQLRKDHQNSQQVDGEGTQRNSCICHACGVSLSDPKPPPSPQPAGLLLHGYLQGLRAGLCPVTENLVTPQAPPRWAGPADLSLTCCIANIPQDSSFEAKRQQVILDLHQSEQEYLSTLFQLCDKYKIESVLPKTQGTREMFINCLEQLSQASLQLRNTLEDRLYSRNWQGLVGDVFARLTCQNEGTFMGIFLGYVRMLPMVLSNFHQSNDIIHALQDTQQESEGLRHVSQLLTPVSRICSYLTHIQDLLQWTSRDHPDHYWLHVSKRALRNFLSQCHVILEQGGSQGDREKAELSFPAPSLSSVSLSCQPNTGSKDHTPSEHCEPANSTHRSEPVKDCHGANGIPTASNPARRRCPNLHSTDGNRCGQGRSPKPYSLTHNDLDACCHGDGRFLCSVAQDLEAAPPPSTTAQGPGSHNVKGSFQDCDTDLDDLGDTSVFDYSSVTSCSPDGTLQMRELEAILEDGLADEKDEDEEEEDSQVPVLLKPSGEEALPVRRLTPGEGSGDLGGRVPAVPPQPPPGKPRNPHTGHSMHVPKTTEGKGVKASLTISPAQPFKPNSPASREQSNTTSRQQEMTCSGKGPRMSEPRRLLRVGGLRSVVGLALFRAQRRAHLATGNTGAWENSEDSDEPCSTV